MNAQIPHPIRGLSLPEAAAIARGAGCQAALRAHTRGPGLPTGPATAPDVDWSSTSGATHLRFFQVRDDHLDPTVRRLDYVLLAPTDRYIGEGYYLVCNSIGGLDEPASFYCSGTLGTEPRGVRLHIQNKLYRHAGHIVSDAEFRRRVVGKIVMTCKVQDHDLLERHHFAA